MPTASEVVDKIVSDFNLPKDWWEKDDWRSVIYYLAPKLGVAEEDCMDYIADSYLSDIVEKIEKAAADLQAPEQWPADPDWKRKVVRHAASELEMPEDEVEAIVEESFGKLAKEGYIRKKKGPRGGTLYCVYSHQTGKCFGCFVEGSEVVMGDGTLKPIEEIETGECVFTHRGRAREVIALSRRHYEGPLIKLRFWGRGNEIVCTPEHPFLLRTFEGECACGCGEKLTYDAIRMGCRFKVGHNSRVDFSASDLPLESFERIKWVEVGDLLREDLAALKGMWGLQPRIKAEIKPPEITPGKAKLLGYFLAEGSYNKYSHSGERYGVSFAFNAEEKEKLEEVSRLLKEEFGVDSTIANNTGNSLVVWTRVGNAKAESKRMVDFFMRYAGEYSRHKRLPEEVLYWDRELLIDLVEGWLLGDGWRRKNDSGWEGCTCSRNLASQISMILAKLGLPNSLVVDRKWRSNWSDGYLMSSISLFSKESTLKAATSEIRPPFSNLTLLEDFCAYRLKSLEVIPDFEGWVFNLEVKEDHSYLVYGVSVHNCYPTKAKAKKRLQQVKMFGEMARRHKLKKK